LIVAVDVAPLESEEAVHDASGTSHLPVVQLGVDVVSKAQNGAKLQTSGKDLKDNSMRFEDLLNEELNQNTSSKTEISKTSNITAVKSSKKAKAEVKITDDVQAFEEKMLGHRGKKAQASALDQDPITPAKAVEASVSKVEHQALTDAHELLRGQDIVELVRGELAQLRKEFRMTQQMNLWQMGAPVHPALAPLRQALQEAPIPAALKALLVDSIHQKETAQSALEEIRSQMIHSIGDAQRALPESGVHVFSGFSGSGKSMTVARLAQHASSMHGAEQVAVISYQDIKPGAWNQTQLLCAQSGADCFRATNAAALQLLLEELSGRRLILIDTSGVQIGDRLLEIQAVSQQLQLQMSMHAVLPADASSATIAKLNQLPQISWTSLVVTKLDESTQPWALLQFLIEQPLGVSLVSRGERMADWSARIDSSEFVDAGLAQLNLASVPHEAGTSQLQSAVHRATQKIAQLANESALHGGAQQMAQPSAFNDRPTAGINS
jgi:flagellar biosynthesis GTPase FlhF